MSDISVVETLEYLREIHTQKLKTAKALQKGISGSTKALNKFSQALDTYSEQNTDLDPNALQDARQIVDQANFRESVADLLNLDLRREVKTLTKIIKSLKDSVSAINSEPPDAVKLHKAYTALQALDINDEAILNLLPDLENELQRAQEQLGAVFGVALREALREWDIELGGRPPRFEAGRFDVLADFASRKASISYGKIEVAKNIPLSLERVLKSYLAEVKRIEERDEDGAIWIEQFYKAWSMANMKDNRKSGLVNINKCYYEMTLLRQKRTFNTTPSKRTFTDYNRAQFAFDFARFVYWDRQATDGWVVAPHVATKSQAESAAKSMWIVTGNGPHDGQYIATIEFEKER